ncbi:MAG: inositol oxygenase [Planctomycetes bacterium]|nr:inositol oxygenase [Planctomycetota bacterium]
MIRNAPQDANNPLSSLDDWDDDVRRRYAVEPDPSHAKKADAFRDYGDSVPLHVREFYRINHQHQTVEFVRAARDKYLPLRTRRMGIWEAVEFLNQLVDDSDPDIQLPQIAHAMQTAEAIRADGHPRWFILTGLLHDMGKVLCLFGEPQWAVTGDTFPVGCRYSEKIVFHEYFHANPDWESPEYQSESGIYEPGCGLDKVLMSWGHDEYLYYVVKDYLPVEAQYMIRYHSFYPGHREREYQHLMDERDREMFRWVRKFNPYDLYTKTDRAPDVQELLPFYRDLVAEFFPPVIDW